MEFPLHRNQDLKWFYLALAAVAGLFIYSFITEFYYTFLLPAVLVIVLLAVYRLDLLFFFSVLITPFSINLARTSLGIGVSLPSEPIIFGAMLMCLLAAAYYGFNKDVLKHPITLVILIHLAWMFVTTATSSMPLVSFKATVARFCFVVVFYYLGIIIFSKLTRIYSFLWCYMLPLAGVILYTTYVHATAGFTEKAAHTAMTPFYNDHTAYAALIAMYLPALFGFAFAKQSGKILRVAAITLLILFISAIVLSYTRASWVSLVAALLCYLVFLLRVRTYVVVTGIVLMAGLFFMFQSKIVMDLEKNDKQSSTDYASHVQSISNISTDASNVERLNRWQSALRMFRERPLFGWGPGTYMFQYAPFQKWSERTIISTNFGTAGNAHSEYIGPLAEQGVPGSVAFILIMIVVIYRGSRIVIHSREPAVRMLAKAMILGLVTYWVHGMLNNFLDTEKASVPFWGFIGALTALDIYHFSSGSTRRKRIPLPVPET